MSAHESQFRLWQVSIPRDVYAWRGYLDVVDAHGTKRRLLVRAQLMPPEPDKGVPREYLAGVAELQSDKQGELEL
jgi:hypothetical protein